MLDDKSVQYQSEASGAKVLVLRADVSDEAQMRDAVQQAIAMFGTIHGVFHTAGVPGAGLIQLKTPEQAARTLLPKVQGTLTLEQSLRGIPLDFLVLFSSITSTTGSPGRLITVLPTHFWMPSPGSQS